MKLNVFLLTIISFTSIQLDGINLITNGKFEQNTIGWYPFQNDGTHEFTLDNINPIQGINCAKITITNGTSDGKISENWRQGVRYRLSIVKNATYSVKFKARASNDLKLVSIFQQNFSPYTYWGYTEWDLTTTVKEFNIIIKNMIAGVGGYWAFVFYYGHLATGTKIWIDDVQIEEIINPETNLLTDGNICNGDFETSTQNLGGEIYGWKTYLVDNTFKMRFEIDSVEPINGKKSIKITNLMPPTYSFSNLQKTYGFDGQNRYAYCPTVIKENGISHLWFCGNPVSGQFIDNIYYMQIDENGNKTSPVTVLLPGNQGKWDDRHVCDPSVVKGNFIFEDKNYKYAMFYLGNNKNYYFNEIGVAFSNSLNSTNWIKYPNPIISKTWTTQGDYQINSALKAWGVGQPSAISLDNSGLVLLAYTIGDVNGTRVEYAKIDISNMTNYVPRVPIKMVDWGLKQIDNMQKDYTSNIELAFDSINNVIVMIRPVHPNPIDYPSYINETLEINYIDLDSFENSTGTWTKLIRISPEISNYPRNHNACIERNSFGKITNWETPKIYFTVSNKTPIVSPVAGKEAEWSYHIWSGNVIKN